MYVLTLCGNYEIVKVCGTFTDLEQIKIATGIQTWHKHGHCYLSDILPDGYHYMVVDYTVNEMV